MDKKVVLLEKRVESEDNSFVDFHCESENVDSCVVRICSFNVNCKFSKTEKYDKWLLSERSADIIAVGFQELYFKLMDIVAPDSIFNSILTIPAHRKWIEFFQSLHNIRDNYTLLLSKSFAGLCLFIFIRKDKNKKSKFHVSNLLVGTVPVGTLGMANKGALSISFRIEDFTLCFINCHLPAGVENPEKRQYSLQAVIQKLQLSQNNKARSKKINFMEADIDIVFLFGDLNFRIQNTTSQAVINIINKEKNKAINSLVQLDELILLRESDALYKCFYEAQIEFLPTYKFFVNSNKYESKRVPSYCDRILWMGNSCLNVSYRSYPEFTFSDHKPIGADFLINLRNKMKRKSDKFTKLKNLPRIRVESTVINFGDVYFMKNNTREKQISNVGRVLVDITFKNIENNKEMPTWFTIIPSALTLEPMESKSVQFRIFIDHNHVSNFNRNIDRLNCQIICASVANGTDTPLTFSGEYHVNVFGLYLDVLKCINRPIYTYKPADIETFETTKNESSTSLPESNLLLLKVLDLLMPIRKFTSPFEDVILHETGNMNNLLGLIEKVNELTITNDVRMEDALYSLGTHVEALMLFIKSLPHPLIPFVVQARLAAPSTDKHHVLKVLRNLPKSNILFLRRMTQYLSNFIKKKGDLGVVASFIASCIPTSSLSLKDTLVSSIKFLLLKPNAL